MVLLESAEGVLKDGVFGAILHSLEQFSEAGRALRLNPKQMLSREGLIDVKIIEALYRSARTAAPVTVEINPPKKRPTRSQQITKPGVPMPKLVNASSPSPD